MTTNSITKDVTAVVPTRILPVSEISGSGGVGAGVETESGNGRREDTWRQWKGERDGVQRFCITPLLSIS